MNRCPDCEAPLPCVEYVERRLRDGDRTLLSWLQGVIRPDETADAEPATEATH